MSYCNKQSIPSFVSESRRAQGLPDRVEDPAALTQVAALLRAVLERKIPEGGRQSDAGRAAAPPWPAEDPQPPASTSDG
jgi:hypothetical protein